MELAGARKRLLTLKTKQQAVEQAIEALRRVKAIYGEGAGFSAARTVRDAPRWRAIRDSLLEERHDVH